MSNPYQITRDLEAALCAYTGARYAVCVNSGTAALLLAVQWCIDGRERTVIIPSHTYVSVPNAVRLAGARVAWHGSSWRGEYQLLPLPIWDSACRFTSGMYRKGEFQCVSFAARKILGVEQGGALLHDNAEADAWFRRMRFDGRTEGVDPAEDHFDIVGMHCIMLPSIAAQTLLRLHHLPKVNPDSGGSEDYPDISGHPAWR